MTTAGETRTLPESALLLTEARELLAHCGPTPALCLVEHWRHLHGTLLDGESDLHAGDAVVAWSLSQHAATALRRLMREHRTAVQSFWEAMDWLAPDDGEPWLPLPGLPYSGHDGYTGGWVSVLVFPVRQPWEAN